MIAEVKIAFQINGSLSNSLSACLYLPVQGPIVLTVMHRPKADSEPRQQTTIIHQFFDSTMRKLKMWRDV